MVKLTSLRRLNIHQQRSRKHKIVVVVLCWIIIASCSRDHDKLTIQPKTIVSQLPYTKAADTCFNYRKTVDTLKQHPVRIVKHNMSILLRDMDTIHMDNGFLYVRDFYSCYAQTLGHMINDTIWIDADIKETYNTEKTIGTPCNLIGYYSNWVTTK